MSKVYTKIVMDFDFNIIEEKSFWYTGTVALCKGDSTASATEQSQAAFNTQLQSIFTQQFANQQGTLNYLKGVLTPMINNPTGYSAQSLAAQRTSADDTLSSNFQDATKALQNTEATRSGDLPSGVNEQLDSGLMANEATDKSQAQNQITNQNENLKESNYWNAINGLNGIAAQNNPLGYAGASTSAANAVTGLSQAVTASSGPSLGAILGGVASGAMSGAGTAIGGIYCWCAAETFNGWFDPRTILVRTWLQESYSKTVLGNKLVKLYSLIGRQTASLMRKNAFVKAVIGKLFKAALKRAEIWKQSCQPTHGK